MKKSNNIINTLSAVVLAVLAGACSSTRNIPEGEQLFAGLTKITYADYEKGNHFTNTREEVSAALATAPNGALFGSSYHRTHFPFGLWIWNAFSRSETDFGKWMTKAFGKAPVLMSVVNPDLRSSVAIGVLRSHGYFRGSVDYNIVEQKNPKEAKIGYVVRPGHLFTIDSLRYVNFPAQADSLIRATQAEAMIHDGDPFTLSALDAERTRLSNLFRNNGYYYYQPDYASYLADTVSVPGKVLLRIQLADGLPAEVGRKWYVGRTDIELRKTFNETLNDTLQRRRFTIHFNGKRSPIRPRVILKDFKLRNGDLYSYDNYHESVSKIVGSGLFSMVDFKFTPRDTTSTCDTLDLQLNCIFDKPYDFYVEANAIGKTTGAFGPGVVVGLTKRNAFRGGEKFDVNLRGSYEWQTGHSTNGNKNQFHSYEYGIDASLEMPRLLLPFRLRRRWAQTPTTTVKASSSVINREKYFKRHVVSGELTYRFHPRATITHEFSPLILQYEYMTRQTEEFMDIVVNTPYLLVSMDDQFVPKMRYQFTYTSPASLRNPIYLRASVSEAANLLSLGYAAFGEKWGEKGKTMFKNPYAQFFKIEGEWNKKWQTGQADILVAHAAAGILWSYGNALSAPYTEQFYVGGANSIRAFNVRSIGPGSYRSDLPRFSYLDQTGDLKLQANLEYRPRLSGHLYGAVFLDAGNVWALRDDGFRPGSQLKMKNLLKETALGTGIGLRYDLEYFVLRLDWGIALHLPYKTGFYNVDSFHDAQCLHFAVGLPF